MEISALRLFRKCSEDMLFVDKRCTVSYDKLAGWFDILTSNVFFAKMIQMDIRATFTKFVTGQKDMVSSIKKYTYH